MYLTLIHLPTKFETDHLNGSQNIERKLKIRDGHLEAILDINMQIRSLIGLDPSANISNIYPYNHNILRGKNAMKICI